MMKRKRYPATITIAVALTVGLIVTAAAPSIAGTLQQMAQRGSMGQGPMGPGPMRAPQADDQVYGSQLMTPEERVQYRERMRNARTAEERQRIRNENHEQMRARARERGITLPDEPPEGRGPGMGRGMGGPGRGMGGGMGGGGR